MKIHFIIADLTKWEQINLGSVFVDKVRISFKGDRIKIFTLYLYEKTVGKLIVFELFNNKGLIIGYNRKAGENGRN